MCFRNYDPYLGITGHYISKDWQLKRFLIACSHIPGSHTAEFLAANIDHLIYKLNLPQYMYKICTTDNAAAMLKATTDSKVIHYGLGCFDHTLQLVINKSLKSDDIPEVLVAINEFKVLSACTHKSPLSQDRIRLECLNMNKIAHGERVNFKKIITHTETRWNSMLMMLISIMHLRSPLRRIAKNLDDHENYSKLVMAIPSEDSFKVLEKVIPVLEVFEMVSCDFESERVPTISMVCAQLKWMNLHLFSLKVAAEQNEEPMIVKLIEVETFFSFKRHNFEQIIIRSLFQLTVTNEKFLGRK